ncbi:magnesium transporter, partial [Pseudomonas sp. BGM005]|nr:magnesium transporter [Pseudomonas sp. BG5]
MEQLKDPDSVSPQAGSGSASPRHERRGVVAAAVYQQGQRIRDIRIEEAGEWRSRENAIVWIGLHEPDEVLLHQVQAEFNLHP